MKSENQLLCYCKSFELRLAVTWKKLATIKVGWQYCCIVVGCRKMAVNKSTLFKGFYLFLGLTVLVTPRSNVTSKYVLYGPQVMHTYNLDIWGEGVVKYVFYTSTLTEQVKNLTVFR